MSLVPGATLGPYRIVEQVGRGGMATVYKAYQPALARYVAIKVLPAFFADEPTYRERFQQEAIAVAKLRHPNILVVFDYGEEGGITYLVSEFVEGGTLADLVGEPLSVEQSVAILGPVASALDFAHDQGILHRDIKPSNILITAKGVPVLSDFGLAKMMDSLAQLTLTGVAVGTPEYMSPEQGEGEEVGPSADNYALGVIAYEMLTGRIPFSARTPLAVLLAHLHQPLPLPRTVNPQVSEGVERVLLKGLAKAPGDRYPSATLFVQALADAGRVEATMVAASPRSVAEVPAVTGSFESAELTSDPATSAVDPRGTPIGQAPTVGAEAENGNGETGPSAKSWAGATSGWRVRVGLVGTALVLAAVAAAVLVGHQFSAANQQAHLRSTATIAAYASPVAIQTITATARIVVTPTLPATPLPGGTEWSTIVSPPNATMGQQLVALKDGRILFAGGEDASYSPTNLASIFNPATKTWTTAAPMHEARLTFAAVLLADGKVLVEGGEYGSQLLASAEIYDPDKNTWTRTASIHVPRRGETTTLLKDGNVLFAGGEDKGYSPAPGAEIYQTRTGTWKTIQAPKFVEHTATLMPDGRVLFECGTEPEYYDPIKDTWTPATPPLEGMNGHFAVLLPSGRLLVGGGIDYANSRQLASAEIFDPTTQTWLAAGTMRSSRYGARAVVLKDGQVLVTGGADAKGVALQSAELYNPGSGRWTDAGTMPTPRESHEEFALSDGTALIGGGVDRNGLANDAVLFSPSN